MANRTRVILPAFLLVVLAFAAYSPALHGSFLWDDNTLLYKNPDVTQPGRLGHIFLPFGFPDFFPLTTLSFYVEYRFFGANPFPYHVNNLLLHIGSALLLWKILHTLRVRGAYLGAALFLLHPVAVESVAWIAERKNTLSMFLYLLTILAYLRAKNFDRRVPDPGGQPTRRGAYVLSLVLFLLALLAKSSVAMLPLILLLLNAWKGPHPNVGSAHPSRPRDRFFSLLSVLPFFGLSLIIGIVTVIFQGQYAFPISALNRSLVLRIAQAGVAVWFYLLKAILPLDLATFYPEWRVQHVGLLAFLPLMLLVGALSTLWFYRRFAIARNTLFAAAIFIVTLLPVLGLVNMIWAVLAPVADHFQYLALPAVTAWLAAGLASLWQPRPSRASASTSLLSMARLLAVCLSIILPFGCLYLTFLQSSAYASEIRLWNFNVLSRPNSFAAHNNLGYALDSAGDLPGAIEQWRIAEQLDPDVSMPHLALAKAYLRLRNPAAALPEFLATLRADPRNLDAYRDLGKCYLLINQPQQALGVFMQMLQHDPGDLPTRFALASLLEQTGKFPAAINEYQTYLRGAPSDPTAHYNLANCQLVTGQTAQAVTEYQAAIHLAPNNAEAYFNLASAYLKSNNIPAAQAALAQARRLDPRLPDIPMSTTSTSHPAS